MQIALSYIDAKNVQQIPQLLDNHPLSITLIHPSCAHGATYDTVRSLRMAGKGRASIFSSSSKLKGPQMSRPEDKSFDVASESAYQGPAAVSELPPPQPPSLAARAGFPAAA